MQIRYNTAPPVYPQEEQQKLNPQVPPPAYIAGEVLHESVECSTNKARTGPCVPPFQSNLISHNRYTTDPRPRRITSIYRFPAEERVKGATRSLPGHQGGPAEQSASPSPVVSIVMIHCQDCDHNSLMVCTYHAVRTRPGASEAKEEGENRPRVVYGFCPFLSPA